MMLEFDRKCVLVIAPHMDDEIIGCGGTLLLFRHVMRRLVVVHMTSDLIRQEESIRVSEMLQVDKSYNLSLTDGYLLSDYKKGVMKLLPIIQREHPDIVLIPHAMDNHVDHRAACNIAIDAMDKARFWPTENSTWVVPVIAQYEVWTHMEHVSEVVDITSVIQLKKELMNCYLSQLDFDYLKYIEYCSGYRGLIFQKHGFAECFMLKKI